MSSLKLYAFVILGLCLNRVISLFDPEKDLQEADDEELIEVETFPDLSATRHDDDDSQYEDDHEKEEEDEKVEETGSSVLTATETPDTTIITNTTTLIKTVSTRGKVTTTTTMITVTTATVKPLPTDEGDDANATLPSASSYFPAPI